MYTNNFDFVFINLTMFGHHQGTNEKMSFGMHFFCPNIFVQIDVN